MNVEPAKTRGVLDRPWRWWVWLLILLFPIPFTPWWLGVICLAVFILLVVLLRGIKLNPK